MKITTEIRGLSWLARMRVRVAMWIMPREVMEGFLNAFLRLRALLDEAESKAASDEA